MYSEVEHNNISDNMILLIYQKPLETTMVQLKQLQCQSYHMWHLLLLSLQHNPLSYIWENVKTISYRPSPCFVMACSRLEFSLKCKPANVLTV